MGTFRGQFHTLRRQFTTADRVAGFVRFVTDGLGLDWGSFQNGVKLLWFYLMIC